jgi:hypothetical protein
MPAGVLQLQSRQHWDEDAPLESMYLAIQLLLPCDARPPEADATDGGEPSAREACEHS